jgi:cyanophycin synthetase
MKKFMEQVSATKKTGIISAIGDRRVEDIKNIGRYSAQMFDEIIIRHGDNRGRTTEELSTMLSVGIREINSNIKVSIISNEIESIQHAIDHAQTGEFIFVCVDDIQNTLAYVQQQIEKEKAPVDLIPVT